MWNMRYRKPFWPAIAALMVALSVMYALVIWPYLGLWIIGVLTAALLITSVR